MSDDTLSRRQLIAAGVAGLALPAFAKPKDPKMTQTARMPTAFLPHGGGPWPFVDMGIPKAELSSLRTYLERVPELLPSKPKALLVVSAHWEESVPTVMSSEKPPMLFDYYGFPPESYRLTWPAPGHPELAGRVRSILTRAGFKAGEDKHRGYDHGTFVPLKVTFAQADIPVVQLSLKAGLDPLEHLEMGRALAPLRDEGVFIVGSGNTFHNFAAFRDPGRAAPRAAEFDVWLRAAATAEKTQRDEQLARWWDAPSGRFAHPREEHLLPLMVVAGAAGSDAGVTPWSGTFGGMVGSAFHYG